MVFQVRGSSRMASGSLWLSVMIWSQTAESSHRARVAVAAWLTRPTVANEEIPLKERRNPPSVHQVDVSW
jgi:hypothetical protein